MQLLLGGVEKLFGRGGQLESIGVIAVQCLVDQQLALHLIAGMQAINQRDGGSGEGKDQYQSSQVKAEDLFGNHNITTHERLARLLRYQLTLNGDDRLTILA